MTVRSAVDLGHALGLSAADTAEIEFRSELTDVLAKIIRPGRLTHAAIAKGAGTSRTQVTAITNGNTHGVSTNVLIRVLSATGHRAEVQVKKAAIQSDNLPMKGRNERTVIPVERIEEVLPLALDIPTAPPAERDEP